MLEQVFLCIRTGASWNDTYWALAEMDLAGGAATLIRQQARDIDELWGRLSRAYLAVRREIPRSIATFSPSTKPMSLSPWRNPRIRSGVASGDLGSSNPITGMAGCCPRAPQRPRRDRTAEERDELAPLHSHPIHSQPMACCRLVRI